MLKKILTLLFLFLIGGITFFTYHFYNRVKNPTVTNTIAAVPQNAALIIQENNFSKLYKKLSSSNIIWEELLENTELVKNINQQLGFFDSIINSSKTKQLLLNQPLSASLHLAGAKSYDFVFYTSTLTKIDEKNLIQEIKTLTKSNPDTRVYENITIYNFPVKENAKISLIYHENVIAFSYSSILIEDVIRQLSSETSLLDNYTFNKAINTAGNTDDGNIFINHKYFHKLPNIFLDANLKDYTKSFNEFAIWSALDMNFKNNAINLNGFSLANDTNNNYLNLFNHQSPQEIEIIDVAPNNTAFIFSYGFSDSKQFFNDKKQLLKSKNQFFNYQKYIDKQNELYGIDIEEEFLAYVGNEISFVITEPISEDYSNEKYIAIKSNDEDNFSSSLIAIAEKTNPDFKSLIYNDYEINKIGLKNLFATTIGKPFYNINAPYYTIVDEYFIFSSSENALKTYLNKIQSEKTLSNDENFKLFNDNLSSSSNIFIYNSIARSVNLYPHFLAKKYGSDIIKQTELLRKFEAVAVQISHNKNDLYYNNIYLKHNPVYKQDTRTVWETPLDTIINSKPQIVANHTNNTKEIFVQDLNNKIYLISNTGKILWSKQLSAKIIGKVHQVDAYKNNKLQYLFSTKTKIYLIDRNGNNVEQYPIKLKATATNGVTPLDYSNNKNYRLLIGCNDNQVYNYNINGELVKGWEYSAADSYAHSNIWHFAINNKDYIVIPLNNGKIKIVERSGKDRIKLNKQLPFTKNLIHLTLNTTLKNCFLSAIDTMGNVSKLFLNDKLENINFNDIPKNTRFGYTNINSDLRNEYIFTFKNKLTVFDAEKNVIIETEINDTIVNRPLFFLMPNKERKIGLVTKNNIYLINQDGSIQDNFPLAGSTLFSISDLNNDNTTNLVVADQNILYMYNLE